MSSKKMTWEDPVIRDGYTQPGYIKPVEGLHGGLRFSYRPMLPEAVEVLETYRDKYGMDQPEKMRAKMAKEVHRQLEGWDVMFDGSPAPLTEENVRRVRMSLQSKLYGVVAGLAGTDIDPEWIDDLDDIESLTESPVEKLGN